MGGPILSALNDCVCGCGSALCGEGQPSCDPDCCACQDSRFTFNAEYLLWWIKGTPVPPILTTGSPNDALPGALGQPGTAVLIGGKYLENDPRSGGRFSATYWFDACHECGLEGSFFFLGQKTLNLGAFSGGTPVLARPFFNTRTNAESEELVAFPGLLAGSSTFSLSTRLAGAQLNLRTPLCTSCCGHVDLIGGYRFLGLDENLQVGETLAVQPVPGAGFVINDSFNTRNRFNGGQIGLESEYRFCRWYVNLRAMIALGGNNQVVNINGSTLTLDPRTGVTFTNRGLLVQPTNSGRFGREVFAYAPEVGINVGYQLTDCLRAYVGYNFLYLNNVLRPANQIDRVVNDSFLRGTATLPSRPAFAFRETDFWAQGLTFGLEFRY
jgi:hypothetical protein